MTTKTEISTDIPALIERLEQELAKISDDVGDADRARAALVNREASVSARIVTIRSATVTLAGVSKELKTTQLWCDHLTAWRQTLCDELLALPARSYSDRDPGKRRNLELSIVTIDRGLPGGTGWAVETLRLGSLMRDSGYVEGPRIANQALGELPWAGSLPEVERRLKDLTARRDDALFRLDEALLDDAERERRAAAAKVCRDAFNAAPQRTTRGDGSQYDRYLDGRIVEVTS